VDAPQGFRRRFGTVVREENFNQEDAMDYQDVTLKTPRRGILFLLKKSLIGIL
jgi:hypothetical protein